MFPCSEKGRVCPLLSASGHQGRGSHMELKLWETSWHLEGSQHKRVAEQEEGNSLALSDVNLLN